MYTDLNQLKMMTTRNIFQSEGQSGAVLGLVRSSKITNRYGFDIGMSGGSKSLSFYEV